MGAIKVPVTSANAVPAIVPDHLHSADISQLTNSLHGDGFYPFKGTVTIGGQTRNKKDLNGEVIVGTGKTIKVRDYVSIIDGVLVFAGNKERLDFNQYTNYTVTGSGTIYITLEPLKVIYDGVERKEHEKGVIRQSATEPVVDSGKILVAKLTNVPASGSITADMIDNSVRDYLQDIDLLKQDVEYIKNMLIVDLYDYINQQINEVKVIIADGDAGVLAALNSAIADIDDQLEAINIKLSGVYTKEEIDIMIEALNALIVTCAEEVFEAMQEILEEYATNEALAAAVDNLTELIASKANASDLADLAFRVGVSEGSVAVLITEVEADTTGLLDRVTALEETPSIPPDLIDRIENLEAVYPPINNVGDNVDLEDIDASSEYSIDGAGKYTLPATLPSATLSDNFNMPDGGIDLVKWDPVGMPVIESNQLKEKASSGVKSKAVVISDSTVEFDMGGTAVFTAGAYYLPAPAVNLRISGASENTYYQLAFSIRGPNTTNYDTVVLVITKYVGGVVKYNSGGLGAIGSGLFASTHVKIVMQNRVMLIYLNGILSYTWTDYDLGGVPYLSTAGKLSIVASWVGTIYIDNVNVIALGGTAYEANGTILSKKLQSTSPIATAVFEGTYETAGVIVPGTVEFKDEFNSWDANRWEVYSGYATIDNGELRCGGNPGGARSKFTISIPATFETKMRVTGTAFDWGWFYLLSATNTVLGGLLLNIAQGFISWNANGLQFSTSIPVALGQTYILRAICNPNKQVALQVWDETKTSKLLEVNFVANADVAKVQLTGRYDARFDYLEYDIGAYTGDSIGVVTFDVSLDGGVNWILGASDGQIIDGVIAPWNGAGNDVRIRANMSTSDTAKTPKIGLMRVNTSSGVVLTKYITLKEKVNEIITAVNAIPTTPTPPIDPLA